MPRLFTIKAPLVLKDRKFKGLRGFAGKPFHPPLTDIPVAAYVFAAIFDVISLLAGEDSPMAHDAFVAASFVLVTGLIVSVATALTGFWDWLKSTPKHTQAWRTANWHMAVMLTVTAIVVIDILLRRDQPDATMLVTILSVLAGALVAYGAIYGGSLVYEYGFNVETSGDHPVWHESETDVYPTGH